MVPFLVAALALGQPSSEERPSHPLAPSLPMATKAENAAFKKVIDRLIEVESGKFPMSAVKEATRDVEMLPPEAIFVLVDRFNFAASNEHSCPAVILARKITKIIERSGDVELVSFVRENAGAGLKAKRHLGVISDLKTASVLRRNYLTAQAVAIQQGLGKPPASMSLAELSGAVTKVPAARLPALIAEAEKRKDNQRLDVLGIAAERKEKDIQNLARGLLRKQTDDASEENLRKLLTHARPEVRRAAIASTEARGMSMGDALIDRLLDDDAGVRRAAYEALLRMNSGASVATWDDTSPGHRIAAVEKWREWWKSKKAG